MKTLRVLFTLFSVSDKVFAQQSILMGNHGGNDVWITHSKNEILNEKP